MTVKECAEWLRERDDFLLITHVRPDGDTLGSAAALCSALRRMGKKAALYANPEITPKYMQYVAPFIADEAGDRCVVTVDLAEEKMFPLGFDGTAELSIDHHPTNTHFAGELLLKAEKAACGEIVLELIKELCGDMTPQEASLLYIAVSTDCGCFRYANVTHETFLAASELTAAGAEIRKLNFELFRQMSGARMKLEGMICAGLRFFRDGAVVAATVTLDMMEQSGATENDCDDLAGIPGRAEGCRVSILIRELQEGVCKVSVRSQPGFDCAALCKEFGGGGHVMAAGCTVKTDPDTTLKLLVSAIDEVWE